MINGLLDRSLESTFAHGKKRLILGAYLEKGGRKCRE
jgi:hypothetical protein